MKKLIVRTILALFALGIFEFTDAGEAFDVVVKTLDTPQNTVWMIEVPNVREPSTPYPQITFAPGDNIRVVAGGCVKVGGKSPSYHQYVDPQGKDTDKYYHGLISVPTLTKGLVRIRDAGLSTETPIPAALPPGVQSKDLFLTLGYEDKTGKYGDNSYLNHDWGPNNECFHERAAYLVVYIGHRGATTSLGTVTERISGLQQVWWAKDKTGLKFYSSSGVACAVHNPDCGAKGHDGNDAWFDDNPPAGVTINEVDFKVFWPDGSATLTHTDRGVGASSGSYGADLTKSASSPNAVVHWQNTCDTMSDRFGGNLTYQVSFLITRPIGVSMGPSVPSSAPFADACLAEDKPTEHSAGPCVVNCDGVPDPNTYGFGLKKKVVVRPPPPSGNH